MTVRLNMIRYGLSVGVRVGLLPIGALSLQRRWVWVKSMLTAVHGCEDLLLSLVAKSKGLVLTKHVLCPHSDLCGKLLSGTLWLREAVVVCVRLLFAWQESFYSKQQQKKTGMLISHSTQLKLYVTNERRIQFKPTYLTQIECYYKTGLNMHSSCISSVVSARVKVSAWKTKQNPNKKK